MVKIQAADLAWTGLAVSVLVWDLACPTGQTLSERYACYHKRFPWTTRAVTLYLVAHLLDFVPERYDPLHVFTGLKPRSLWGKPAP